MKTILLFFLSTLTILTAAEPTYHPQEALDKFGKFTITDNSSYFTFSKDGTFQSGPMSMSGRELRGTWTLADKTQLTVTAKVGWMNGLQPRDDYRRIVFRISFLQKRSAPPPKFSMGPADLFDGYCLIEELVTIPKPKDAKPDQF